MIHLFQDRKSVGDLFGELKKIKPQKETRHGFQIEPLFVHLSGNLCDEAIKMEDKKMVTLLWKLLTGYSSGNYQGIEDI